MTNGLAGAEGDVVVLVCLERPLIQVAHVDGTGVIRLERCRGNLRRRNRETGVVDRDPAAATRCRAKVHTTVGVNLPR